MSHMTTPMARMLTRLARSLSRPRAKGASNEQTPKITDTLTVTTKVRLRGCPNTPNTVAKATRLRGQK